MACNDIWHPDRVLNAERVKAYQPGGLHPVDIGGTFKLGRYKIVRKLGHGSSSTVWLAQDNRYRTLKSVDVDFTC